MAIECSQQVSLLHSSDAQTNKFCDAHRYLIKREFKIKIKVVILV